MYGPHYYDYFENSQTFTLRKLYIYIISIEQFLLADTKTVCLRCFSFLFALFAFINTA